MIKDVKYSGYTAQPSDYEAPDGDLALSLNLIPEDGAIRPLSPPVIRLKALSPYSRVIFIHKNSFTHYIIFDSQTREISWIDSETINPDTLMPSVAPTTLPFDFPDSQVTDINAIGNTLVIASTSALHYLLFRDGVYHYLGTRIPEIPISFSLVGHPRLYSVSDESHKPFRISFDDIYGKDIWSTFPEDTQKRITEQILAKVNRFVSQQTTEKGRFCFPFFIRYAIRLYDGSLIHHSSPILLNPATMKAPLLFWQYCEPKPNYTNADCDIMLMAADIEWQVLPSSDLVLLDQWSDIIESIEIFASAPLYTYNQAGVCKLPPSGLSIKGSTFIGRLFADNTASDAPIIASPTEDKLVGEFVDKLFLQAYSQWTYAEIYQMYFSAKRRLPEYEMLLPAFSDDKMREQIISVANYYKLASIDIKDIKAAVTSLKRKKLKIPDDYLQSLMAHESMTDDYHTHDILSASRLFPYNNRMNLAGVARYPFSGYFPESMFQYVSAHHNFGVVSGTDRLNVTASTASASPCRLTVIINDQGHVYSVESILDSSAIPFAPLFSVPASSGAPGAYTPVQFASFFFYPDTAATKIIISHPDYGSKSIPLVRHDFLNGAYAWLGYDSINSPDTAEQQIPTQLDGFIPVPAKVYTSEVNNPFFFPLLGINTVGTGEVRAICSAAKALSQGQFGQFPLYAFTTEGVWALEVSATGTYSARQPITRDVIINGTEPLQLDSSVLFVTDRGLMLIAGSEAQCISDRINTPFPFDALSLPGMASLHSMLGHLPDTCLPTAPFLEFAAGCSMLYDYVHQHVIVYNPSYSYAYVYSLKSGQWGMMLSTVQSSLNSYPQALAVDTGGALVDFSADAEPAKGLLLTRPLKLDAADVLKTIDTVIQRGNFRRGHVQSVLYGSRDLFNWSLVWSSKDHFLRGFSGSPYKYFRIALLCSLDKSESIYGATFQFNPRKTNQPR